MFFKKEYTVRKLWLFSGDQLVFDEAGTGAIKVELRPWSDKKRVDSKDALLTATCERSISPRVSQVFADIQANKIHDFDPDGAWSSYKLPDGSTIKLPSLCTFPQNFQDFVNGVSRELREFSLRTIDVLRWRAGIAGPVQSFASIGFCWSLDNEFWHQMPSDSVFRMEVRQQQRFSQRIQEDSVSILTENDSEPVHHNLYREAWEHRYDFPRSAMVIGVAAAELAVKRCISRLIPQAEWLATNLPSPPLHKILTEYLPRLPAKNKIDGLVKPPPKFVLEHLRDGVQIRNELAHAGGSTPTGEKVELILLSIKDLLWLVDYYSGYEWAIDYLRPTTRQSLDIA